MPFFGQFLCLFKVISKKMVRGTKSVKISKKWIKHVKYIISMPINIIFTILLWSQKIGPVNLFLQLYMFLFEHSTLNHVWVTYKWLFQYWETIFEGFDLPLWKFLWSDTCLACLASKTKIMLKPDLLPPNDLKNIKKYQNLIILKSGLSYGLQNFFGLFYIFLAILRSK